MIERGELCALTEAKAGNAFLWRQFIFRVGAALVGDFYGAAVGVCRFGFPEAF